MHSKNNRIFLLLGGNLGDVKIAFELAEKSIRTNIGRLLTKSSLFKSEAWGFESINPFLNQVLEVSTSLKPSELLVQTQGIEKTLGRVRNPEAKTFESRLIDIDILYYNSEIIKTKDLEVPHYALHERKFTLLPLSEIAPNFEHPILRKTNLQLLNTTTDTSNVQAI